LKGISEVDGKKTIYTSEWFSFHKKIKEREGENSLKRGDNDDGGWFDSSSERTADDDDDDVGEVKKKRFQRQIWDCGISRMQRRP
jgi:hypothetical protein